MSVTSVAVMAAIWMQYYGARVIGFWNALPPDAPPPPLPLSPPPEYLSSLGVGFERNMLPTIGSFVELLGQKPLNTTGCRNSVLATMVHNEADIVADWVHYHASLFGYESIYVYDNNSTDGTWQVLTALQRQHGIRLGNEPDYGEKPTRMRSAFLEMQRNSRLVKFLIPLDVDEFITLGVAGDKVATHNVTALLSENVCKYMETLPVSPKYKVYKMRSANAYFPDGVGSSRAAKEAQFARFESNRRWQLQDHGRDNHEFQMSKGFLPGWFVPTATMDHGNHFQRLRVHAYATALVLVHYHARNREQLIKKTVANWKGLGKPLDKEGIRKAGGIGIHYQKPMLDILGGVYNASDMLKREDCTGNVVSLDAIVSRLTGHGPYRVN